ncbi:hypothetical protein MCOR27_001636 [Pyricularia oryzae]|nr:hypothetical protein MCOR27_001636 [Pyricularia oryzae]KAI6448197.1 hypothetical protein MCOR22_002948 [Pyricularia oryzae]
MQPLNPFLAAFSKSSLLSQCSPTAHYVVLVPATDVLLTSRDVESGSSVSDAVATEEFLGSHVLRIPSGKAALGPSGVKEAAPNLREMRGKARQYNTVNGKSVVIKDNMIYTNKGFKSLAHATLLGDAIWYSNTLEHQSWLVYYISQPLVGSWEEVKIVPAIVPGSTGETGVASSSEAGESAAGPRKKDIKTFQALLQHFPIIARQMQPGLEKLLQEFTVAFDRPLPPPPSSHEIPDPVPDGPITAAIKRARSYSATLNKPAVPSNGLGGASRAGVFPDDSDYQDDEDVMRASLETAVTSAIDIFQAVDKSQLSLLGATTDLTGPFVERLIERYVAESVHYSLWMKLYTLKRHEELELEAKIRQMTCIDISQLGLPIEGGCRGKHELTKRLEQAVTEFRNMQDGESPQAMMDALLATIKAITQVANAGTGAPEKSILTMNADTLVSLLLFVVIRSRVRMLHTRLTYIRHFIFIDDVENGEMGYAVSTFEAVLAYLDRDSAVLVRSSHRNSALWKAVGKGDVDELRRIMEPSVVPPEFEEAIVSTASSRRASSVSFTFSNGTSEGSSKTLSMSERFSCGSSLSHVFPFHHDDEQSADETFNLPPKRMKRVTMDTRSMSSGSEISFRSRATSIGTLGSVFEADTSIETLTQTQNSRGESVLMMAVQQKQPESLKYLLSLSEFYPIQFLMEDCDNEDTTLLSAAVQLGHAELVTTIMKFLTDSMVEEPSLRAYFAMQDSRGRSVAHYMFNAPFLLPGYGVMMPWWQKDKNGQTPLFALCRSYDHPAYYDMVNSALDIATICQGDGQPLHLDQHMDAKGNTLLHIVHNAQLALRILQTCDVNVNATNEKKFTPLMVASKYGRFELVRVFFSDPRVDHAAKELRGLTAVELAKDDDVRNKIDDLTLFAVPSGPDLRTTAVVRAYFVEDATIRFVLKSGAPVDKHSYAVTTCRRSLSDFELLAQLLAMENPASWIPSINSLRTPFQIPSKPSRAVLKDLQMRMDWFLRMMLTHSTFGTHEMLWEFFLVPDLQSDMMEQRSRLKAETRAEKVREELEPLDDVREVSQFVDHALEMVRGVSHSTKSVARRATVVGNVTSDLHTASLFLHSAMTTLVFLPKSHIQAFEIYVQALAQPTFSPQAVFHTAFLAVHNSIEAILGALARPHRLISQIDATRRQAERNYSSLSRSTRWPLGLLDDTRQRLNEEREEKLRQSQQEGKNLSKELRYSQQVVAGELAGWQEMHEKIGRRAIKDLAKSMVVLERTRMDGFRRALRVLQADEDGKRPRFPRYGTENSHPGEAVAGSHDGGVGRPPSGQ